MIKINAKIIRVNANGSNDSYVYENLHTHACLSVPCWCLDDFVLFPSELINPSTGHLVEGAIVNLSVDEHSGKTYPGSEYAKRPADMKSVRNSPKISLDSLFDNVKDFSIKTLDELKAEYIVYLSLGRIDNDTQLRVLRMMSPPCDEDELYDALLDILGLTGPGLQEDGCTEFKSSFYNSAVPNKDQQYEIICELVSFANSHVGGKVYVGVDRDGDILDLKNEMLQNCRFPSREAFEANFLNRIKQTTQNFAFMQSVTFNWYKTDDEKLFCCINVKKWDDGIILLGNELWVRNESAKHLLKYNDLIDYIKKNG